MLNKDFRIIAGPCSVDYENFSQLKEILSIKINNQRAVFGVRVVGLKSRTNFFDESDKMGIDYSLAKKNLVILHNKKKINQLKIYPSVKIAQKIIKEFGCVVATEVMFPHLQLPVFEKYLSKEKVFLWNPSVNQLGWPIWEMSYFAQKNDWYLGLKNPKWLGKQGDSFIKTWKGLYSYASSFIKDRKKIFFIHRGVDVEEKGDYRNLPVHHLIEIIKEKDEEVLIFFDPSHTHGAKLKDKIVEETIKVAQMKTKKGSFLYDGILIEVGTSKTDTHQHITIKELEFLCQKISQFRKLVI